MRYDCVIRPNFGGFVANRTRAVVSDSSLSPSSRSFVFNSLLIYNDGLLAQEYMREEKLGFADAMSCIAESVAQLEEGVRKNGELAFGCIGFFSLSIDGALLFRSNENADLDIDNYGLQKVLFAPVVNSSSRSFANGVKVAMAAAAVLLLLLLPVSVIESPRNSSEAALSSVLKSLQVPASEIVDTVALSVENDTVEDTLVMQNGTVPDVFEVVGLEEQVPKSVFHVIIASLPTRAKALQFLREKASYGFESAQIVNAQGRYRVSVASFESNLGAQSFLSGFVSANKEFAEAWVFEEILD